jgi:predicted dehydrogenase
LEAARDRELLIGCAPDTFLGGGLQTCRKLIDDGWIGEPIAATAFMMCHGHENWHPDPEFYYQVGGGPMFDMGPYYVTALIHLMGPVRRIITSFDVWAARLPWIEVYGTEGSLAVPDPNGFDGPVVVRRAGASEWNAVPLTHGYTKPSRGIGVADIAYALHSGRPHRANGELAYHVLDIMHAFHQASQEGRHVELTSTCSRPEPLPLGLAEGTLDE